MAQDPKETVEGLIPEIGASRAVLTREILLLREKLDVRARLRRKFDAKPLLWIGAVTSAGIVLGLLAAGRKR